MSETPVRLAFVGVGGMGQCAHLRNYVIHQGCQVVALAEIRPRLGHAVATRYGVPRVYPSHRELLASEPLDGIVAIQPFSLHGELVPDLLAKGVPVLTEKPLANSLDTGRRIMAAVTSAGGRLYLAYHKRSDPASMYALDTIKAWKASGEVGRMRYVRVAMPPGDWSAAGFSHLIRSDEKYDAKWGPPGDPYVNFVNYYIHQVNLLRYLLGEDYQVTAADPGGVVMLVRSSSGVTGTLEMATHSTTLDWQEEAFVAFERGWIRLELPAPMVIDRPGRVTVFRDPAKGVVPTTTVPTLPPVHAMRQQAAHFIEAVRGKETALSPASDGLKDLEIAQQYLDLLNDARRKVGVKEGA